MHRSLTATRGPILTVVIPTRHEAGTIEDVLRRIRMALAEVPTEIIVVDDSDHDSTLEILERVRDEFDGALVVEHRAKGSVPERTLGTAAVRGISLARGEFVCVMDGDGQHPPEAIPAMLEQAQRTGSDYVGASRYLPGGSA